MLPWDETVLKESFFNFFTLCINKILQGKLIRAGLPGILLSK